MIIFTTTTPRLQQRLATTADPPAAPATYHGTDLGVLADRAWLARAALTVVVSLTRGPAEPEPGRRSC